MAGDMGGLSTVQVSEAIERCEDIDTLRSQILATLPPLREQWSECARQALADSGLSKTDFAALCGVSRTMLYKWLGGAIPEKRELFLKIGLLAGYDASGIDRLLTRYGRYPGLYPKCLEDSVCLYVLAQQTQAAAAVEAYEAILARIRASVFVRLRGAAMEGAADVTTQRFAAELRDVQGEDALERFIEENAGVYFTAFHKFYAYVRAFLEANEAQNLHQMANAQGWTSSLAHAVSGIRQSNWYPTRNKIISLGLHLAMDREQVDEMLALVHMEPLCAKHPLESVVIYILESAMLSDVLNEADAYYDPDGLCRYAATVFRELDQPELTEFYAEISKIDADEQELEER